MKGLYILVGQTPVAEPHVLTWAEWFETTDRTVAVTELPGFRISTAFIGVDFHTGPPRLFETMVFVNGVPQDCYRCATWLEAEAQHQRIVLQVGNL